MQAKQSKSKTGKSTSGTGTGSKAAGASGATPGQRGGASTSNKNTKENF